MLLMDRSNIIENYHQLLALGLGRFLMNCLSIKICMRKTISKIPSKAMIYVQIAHANILRNDNEVFSQRCREGEFQFSLLPTKPIRAFLMRINSISKFLYFVIGEYRIIYIIFLIIKMHGSTF